MNDNVLRWMPHDLTDDKSALVQVMAWCRQAISHYLNQCWPRSPTPYDLTRPQWVKSLLSNNETAKERLYPQQIAHLTWLLKKQSLNFCRHAKVPASISLQNCGFTKEVNSRLAKRPLVFNCRLANRWLTFFSKRGQRWLINYSHSTVFVTKNVTNVTQEYLTLFISIKFIVTLKNSSSRL